MITQKQPTKAPKRPKTELERLRDKAKREALENKFHFLWRALNGPDLVREYRFIGNRKWRFDFAHKDTQTAIEIEGGTWSGGRHTRGKGFEGDCEKYNAANDVGWRVYKLTSKMIDRENVLKIIGTIKTEIGRLEP